MEDFFTLTTSATDVVTGTTGNDTIIGDFLTSGTDGTVQASDAITGGAGTDTFKIYSFNSGGTDLLPVSVSGVEIFDFVAAGGKGKNDIDTTAYKDVTTVRLEQADNYNGAGAGKIVTGNGQGLQLSTATGMKAALDWNASTTDTAETLTLSGFNDKKFGLTITGAAKLATLNVVSDTAANTVSLTDASNSITKLVISGGQSLNLSNAPLGTKLVTVDASASTGGVNVQVGDTKATNTLTGGSGNDTFDLTQATAATKEVVALGAGNDTVIVNDKFSATSTFDGGDGTDTVGVTKAGFIDATTGKQFSNFEVYSARDTTTAGAAFDVSTIAGITAVTVDADVAAAGNASINKLTTQSVTITQDLTVNDLALNLKDSTGKADSLNVVLTSGTGAGDLGINSLTIDKGVETINLASNKVATENTKAGNVITTLDLSTGTNAQTLVVTGDELLTVTTANEGSLVKIDASGDTGGFVMGAKLTTNNSVQYAGGSAADTFIGNATGGATGDTFYGAGGGDTLTLGASNKVSDTLVYKALSDSQVDGKTNAGLDTVSNFESANDKIDLTAFNFTANKTVGNLGALAADPTAGASVADLFKDVAGTHAVEAGTFGGDTYVFVDVNKDGNFSAANDLVIKLVGNVDLTSFSNSNIVFG